MDWKQSADELYNELQREKEEIPISKTSSMTYELLIGTAVVMS